MTLPECVSGRLEECVVEGRCREGSAGRHHGGREARHAVVDIFDDRSQRGTQRGRIIGRVVTAATIVRHALENGVIDREAGQTRLVSGPASDRRGFPRPASGAALDAGRGALARFLGQQAIAGAVAQDPAGDFGISTSSVSTSGLSALIF